MVFGFLKRDGLESAWGKRDVNRYLVSGQVKLGHQSASASSSISSSSIADDLEPMLRERRDAGFRGDDSETAANRGVRLLNACTTGHCVDSRDGHLTIFRGACSARRAFANNK
jgi:hypothetical protein